MIHRKAFILALILGALLVLSSCTGQVENKPNSDTKQNSMTGKKNVYIYCPEGRRTLLDSIGGIIDCFNYESSDYSIVIIDPDETIDPIFQPDKRPDIIIEELGSKIDQYAAGGYLEDLYPYIDKSERLSRDDIPSFPKESFETDGKLYALFRRINLNAILISDSDATQKEMEPYEFLEWLLKQDEIYAEGTLDINGLTMLCLMQTIANYVDIESGKANFESDSFADMLVELKKCKQLSATSAFISDSEVISGDLGGFTFIKQRVDGLNDLAQCEAAIRSNLCRIKLIGNGNSNSSCFFVPYENVGIFANAECKEGAYAFIEYLMTTENTCLVMGVPTSGDIKQGLCYSLRSVREKAFDEAIGKIDITLESGTATYEITDRHRTLMEELVKDAKYLNSTYAQILSIAIEESGSFIQGNKDLSVVTNIIQNRVQMLLNEKKQ